MTIKQRKVLLEAIDVLLKASCFNVNRDDVSGWCKFTMTPDDYWTLEGISNLLSEGEQL